MKLKNLWAALLTLAAVFMLASCDQEDGNGNGTSDTIVGKWTLYLEETTTTDAQGHQDSYSYTYEPGELVVEFQADGTALSFEAPDPEPETATWTLNGDQLILNFEGDLEVYTVKELSEQLVLEYTENDADGKLLEVMTFNRY